jgi:hypothetical protein
VELILPYYFNCLYCINRIWGFLFAGYEHNFDFIATHFRSLSFFHTITSISFQVLVGL